MKKIVKINIKNNIEYYSSLCDGFIVGLKDFSIDYDDVFSCEEIKDLVEKYSDKEIFVAMNKNIFNNELESVEKILMFLNALKVKVLFYDMSILYLKRKKNLEIDLVWNQTHMVTNYNTCNYYYDKGSKYAFVAGEITLDEIIEIKEKSKSSLLVQVVGHQVMSHSRRRLLTNYYTSIDRKYDGGVKTISENDKKYLIKETKDGATIKTDEILNGLPFLNKLKDADIDYIVIDESYINTDTILSVLNLAENIICGRNVSESIEKSKELIGDNTSFLFKKTIYKVKKEG